MTSMRKLRSRDRAWRRYLARYGAPTGWHSPRGGIQGVPGYWRNRSRLVWHPNGGPAFVSAETRRRIRRGIQQPTAGEPS